MKAVEIVLWTGLHVRKADVDPATVEAIRELHTYPNPLYDADSRMREKEVKDWAAAKAAGVTMKVRFAWREKPPATISGFDEDDEWIVCPRGGGLLLLSNLLRERGYVPTVRDIRCPGDSIDVRLSEGWEPYEYQRQAVIAMTREQRGYTLADTAAGKTVVAMLMIAELGVVTLCIAHTTEILDGWEHEILGHEPSKTVAKLDGNFKVTRIQGKAGAMKAAREGDIILATIQTLWRLPQEIIDVLNRRVGFVMDDEAHHAPADTFWIGLSRLASKYRNGLTATDKRKDGLDFLLLEIIGPKVYEIGDRILARSKKVLVPRVRFVPTPFYPRVVVKNRHGEDVVDPVASREIADSTYNRIRLLNMMVEDDARNDFICDQVEQDWKDGHVCLVSTERVKHCATLETKLRARGMVVGVLKGGRATKIARARKREMKEGVAEGRIDVIVGTKVIDEGVNFPRLSALHLTCPGNNEAQAKQRPGRVRRPEGKQPCVVRDYVDYRCRAVIDSYQNRRRWYRKWGWPIEDIDLMALLS